MAHTLAVRPPTVTAVVDGLVHRGLVERRTVEGDRRRVAHVLTDQGRRLLEQADRSVDARLCEVARYLDSADEADRALAGLSLWRKALVASRRAVASR
jgi:DNA-binding MarR family transcriptional regulator